MSTNFNQSYRRDPERWITVNFSKTSYQLNLEHEHKYEVHDDAGCLFNPDVVRQTHRNICKYDWSSGHKVSVNTTTCFYPIV